MTIFDGVAVKPTLSPTMQGVLSMMVLVANSIVAADKCRQERLAGEEKRPTTLEEVMEKSGLNIPGIHDALAQLMGGTDEAKKAASLIVSTPDPAKLLRQFAEQFGVGMTGNTGPIVTPPPAPTPEPATPPPMPSGLPKFRPDFTREAREATKATANESASPLPKFRPDFTREAREAAKAANAPAPEIHEQAQPCMAPTPSETPRPSLVSMVEHQLGALRRRMKAHEAELDTRLQRAEAELAMLRRELHELRAAKGEPAHVVVAPAQMGESVVETPAATPVVDEPAVVNSDESAAVAASETNPEPVAELALDLPLPAAASEEEVARAVELIGEFAEEVEEHHQHNLVRVVTVEHDVSVMRALVQLERSSVGVSAHG